MVETVLEAFGEVDFLVNNAGIAVLEDLEPARCEGWNDVLASNLTGPFLCARQLVLHLARSGRGAIVNVGSTNGIVAMRGSPPTAPRRAACTT